MCPSPSVCNIINPCLRDVVKSCQDGSSDSRRQRSFDIDKPDTSPRQFVQLNVGTDLTYDNNTRNYILDLASKAEKALAGITNAPKVLEFKVDQSAIGQLDSVLS